MSNVVLALSGGLDSTVLLATALSRGHTVSCVHFGYGSKHNPYERNASDAIARHYGIQRHYTNIEGAFRWGQSALLNNSPQEIPDAHQEDPSQKATIVPGRNLIFAAILASIAQSQFQESEVWLGVHLGDHNIYPDCRAEWLTDVERAIRKQSEFKVELVAPFVDWKWNKVHIVAQGIAFKVPFELTRTCYKHQDIACGECGACRERLEAFAKNNAVDPLDRLQS